MYASEQQIPVTPPDDQRSFTAEPPSFWRSLLLKNTLFVAIVVVLTAGILGHLAYIFARDILHDNIRVRFRRLLR